MKLQSELRKSKQIVREWVRANFSEQKLASVYAFNADGRMSFRNPCGCLMGVTYSDRLHEGPGCNQDHYWVARQKDLAESGWLAALFSGSGMGKTERAYILLGYSAKFNTCFGDDELRRRRLSAVLRAEMRRRARLESLVANDAIPLFAPSEPVR